LSKRYSLLHLRQRKPTRIIFKGIALDVGNLVFERQSTGSELNGAISYLLSIEVWLEVYNLSARMGGL
jgi:hypothetical protein